MKPVTPDEIPKKKVRVEVATVKTVNWKCPNCERDNVDNGLHPQGLLFCKCTHAFEVGHISDSKTFYYAPEDKETYMIVYEDAEVGNETFTDIKAAIKRFEVAKDMWNCHLFGLLMSG